MTFQKGDKNPMKNPEIVKKVSDKLKGRLVWNKGLTKETNESVKRISISKLGEKNPMKRPDVRKKFSESNKGRTPWNAGTKGKTSSHNKGLKGIHLNPKNEFKKGLVPWNEGKKGLQVAWNKNKKGIDLSPNNKFKFKKGHVPWMKGKTFTDEAKERIKLARLKQVFPTKDTKIEILIQNELKNRSIKFSTHIPLIGQPDIFIEPNVCIFVDGCYWHGCKVCGFDNALKEEKDRKITEILMQKGMHVFRLWEHDVMRDAVGCIDEIMDGKK